MSQSHKPFVAPRLGASRRRFHPFSAAGRGPRCRACCPPGRGWLRCYRLVTTSTLMPVAAVNSAPTCCSIPIALPVPPTRNVSAAALGPATVSYTHLRAHETVLDLVCRLLLEKKKKT